MQNFDIPKFKIRASAIGKIMTNSKGKSIAEKIEDLRSDLAHKKAKKEETKPTLKTYANLTEQIGKIEAQISELKPFKDEPNLSQTCITFLESWVNEHVYQRRVEFSSKQTDKGNKVEDDAIVYVSGHIEDLGLASKNLDKFNDDDITGEPDILTDDYVFDIKSSWSHDTFPLYSEELPTTDYDWQVTGYMAITGREKGRVVYALMSMPEELIMKEARWKLGYNYDHTAYQEFADQFRYDTLPPFLRIKEYEVAFDAEKIEAIRKRVKECRNYIDNVIIPALEKNAKKYGE